MDIDLSSFADDFFVNMNLLTALDLPSSRETVLHFFEAVGKQFTSMTTFYQRESGEVVLEGDRDRGSYRWLEMHGRRLTAGYFNPPTTSDAYHFHRWLLERSVYYLGVASLDVESLDVLFGFNLEYKGNRDQVVAEALLAGSPLGEFADRSEKRCVEFEPSMVVALHEDLSIQARVSLETRSTNYQVRTGQYESDPISVYLTVRRYAQPGHAVDMQASFPRQCSMAEDLACSYVLPRMVQPIAQAISTAQ